MLSTVTGPDLLPTTRSDFLDGRKADVGPDGNAYTGHQHNPDGSSVYSLSDADVTLGVRSPVNSSVEFMGSSTDPKKTTLRSRLTTLSNLNDLSSVQTYTETQTVNGRAQPDKLVYDASAAKFTTTSPAGRTTSRTIDAFGRTKSVQIGSLTPIIFTYDDVVSKTGKVSSTTRDDGTIRVSTSFGYYGAGNGNMSGYLSDVTYSLNSTPRQRARFQPIRSGASRSKASAKIPRSTSVGTRTAT